MVNNLWVIDLIAVRVSQGKQSSEFLSAFREALLTDSHHCGAVMSYGGYTPLHDCPLSAFVAAWLQSRARRSPVEALTWGGLLEMLRGIGMERS